MRARHSGFVRHFQSIGGPSRSIGALLGVAVLLAGVLQTPASATAANPYANSLSTSHGYDVSYPNCSATAPLGDYFAIVGLGGGRPFAKNSCAAAEWAAALSPTTVITPSLYFNTGYAGAYSKSIDSNCAGSSSKAGVFAGLTGHKLTQAEQAWAIGCSEVDFAHTYAASFRATSPTMWWADIETGNSWSTNVDLNQFALDGMSSEMALFGLGGFYSSSAMWSSITGSSSWTTQPPATANWVAGSACNGTVFDSGAPVWLSQGVPSNGIDSDIAC